jgi:transposase
MERKCIKLTAQERAELKQFCTKGVRSARLINRARIILALDTSVNGKAGKQEEIARQIGVSRQTVINVQNDFIAMQNASQFLQRKKRQTPPVPPKVTGELEARIIALACGEAPEGFARWTLRLLADRCVELSYIHTISHTTISSILKKTNLSLI